MCSKYGVGIVGFQGQDTLVVNMLLARVIGWLRVPGLTKEPHYFDTTGSTQHYVFTYSFMGDTPPTPSSSSSSLTLHDS